MTCTDEGLPTIAPYTRPAQLRRIDGNGYIALALTGRFSGHARGLALILAVVDGLNLAKAAGAIYGQAFSKHALPWVAIGWVYRSAAGNFYQCTVDAKSDGGVDLRREPLRNMECYDLIAFLQQAGYSLCRDGSGLIEAALHEANTRGFQSQQWAETEDEQ
jgi:hypothetical protein